MGIRLCEVDEINAFVVIVSAARHGDEPYVKRLYAWFGKASLLLSCRMARLLVLMCYRCIVQPTIIGTMVSLALMPLLGGTVASRVAFAR